MRDDLSFQCPMCNAHLPEEARGHVDENLCGICEDPANREEGQAMSEHTPGPWVATASGVYLANGGADLVADVFDPHCEGGEAANARLIAAAPELLEACREALAGLERRGEGYSQQSMLRAAIAKATGADND